MGKRCWLCLGACTATPAPVLALALPFVDAGSFVSDGAVEIGGGVIMYGGRGILSLLIRWIWDEIISSNCFSEKTDRMIRGDRVAG